MHPGQVARARHSLTHVVMFQSHRIGKLIMKLELDCSKLGFKFCEAENKCFFAAIVPAPDQEGITQRKPNRSFKIRNEM